MLYKKRTKPLDLEVLEILNRRSNLMEEELKNLYAKKQGYNGEMNLDEITSTLQTALVLNDLRLFIRQSCFQLDALIITPQKIHTYEIKNFTGIHYYQNDNFFRESGFLIDNPLLQSQRASIKLQQLLATWHIDFPIECHTVFIHPHFTLFQCPINKGILLRSQLDEHFKRIQQNPGTLTSRHYELAERLATLHSKEDPYWKRPDYLIEQLKKGITCPNCFKLNMEVKTRTFICRECKKSHTLEDVLQVQIHEFQTLFPDTILTTTLIADWCDHSISKKRIRRYLNFSYTKEGLSKATHYL